MLSTIHFHGGSRSLALKMSLALCLFFYSLNTFAATRLELADQAIEDVIALAKNGKIDQKFVDDTTSATQARCH